MSDTPTSSASALPTLWQRKVLWVAISFLSIAVIATLSVLLLQIVNRVLGFLQPLLVPVAFAGVMAFLFEPLVQWLGKKRIPRMRAVILIFFAFSGLVLTLLTWLIPMIFTQSQRLAERLPAYAENVRVRVGDLTTRYLPDFKLGPFSLGDKIAKPAPSPIPDSGATPVPSPDESVTLPPEVDMPDPSAPELSAPVDGSVQATESEMEVTSPYAAEVTEWLQEQLPTITTKLWQFLRSSVGGFLGAFGFLLSFILVPVYLFFFLSEAPKIAAGWSDYVPLRASALKDEVVSVVSEINGYLINFFRGQLVVSMIDGALTGTALLIVGLDFALLIGLLVGILGLIPYAGILLCWIPAVIIAVVQWPGEWFHPILVTVIFIGVQNLDGIFIAPKIVGESVGLHPLTVIVSVLVWSLLLGGLLGAILAVPLTATLKVLFRRYLWDKQLAQKPGTHDISKDLPPTSELAPP